LRNTYTLLDAGNAVDDSVDQVAPFIQLASIIDPVAARQDFINIRLNGNASALSDPSFVLLPANETQHSPIPPGEKTKELEEKVLSRLPYIILGAAVLLALITACCIWHCCCRRGGRGGCCRRKPKNVPIAGTGASYLPLGDRHLHHDNRSIMHDNRSNLSAASLPSYDQVSYDQAYHGGVGKNDQFPNPQKYGSGRTLYGS